MIWLFPLLALPVVDPDQIVRTQPSKAVNRKLGFVARPDAHGSRTRYLDWSTKVCLELNPPLLLVWYSSLRLRPVTVKPYVLAWLQGHLWGLTSLSLFFSASLR